MLISICIPTFRPIEELTQQIDLIKITTLGMDVEVYASCIKQSAAKNRNLCIHKTSGDIILMCDDDVETNQRGWCQKLIEPLIKEPEKYSIVSARCKNPDGSFQAILGDNNVHRPIGKYQTCIHSNTTNLQMVASACIAFRRVDVLAICDKVNLPFDINYGRACFEDSDFSMVMRRKFPDRDIIFVNDCQIIHKNAMAWRDSEQVRKNNRYFNKKWRLNI